MDKYLFVPAQFFPCRRRGRQAFCSADGNALRTRLIPDVSFVAEAGERGYKRNGY
jgi:hypothetical protein